jgi:hypothetical protein
MTGWKTFAVGLLCGFILAFCVFRMVGQRYRMERGGPSGVMMIRLDTWTGESWMQRWYADKEGSKIWFWERMDAQP